MGWCLEGKGQIAAWDFYGESSPATSSADIFNANLSSSNFITRGASASASTASNSFRTTGFQNNGISTSNTDYFQITIGAASGYKVSLSTIDAKFAGTNTFYASPGVTSQFAYSLDGTNFTLIGSPVQSTSLTMAQIDLSGITALQNVASGTTITLRYYASGQTATGGWGFSSASAGTYGLAIGGTVTTSGPTITVSLSSLSGFTYVVGAGPSTSQSYNLSGSNLTGFPGNIAITGSTNYEVSTDNSTFSSSVNVNYTSATLSSTPIYVRLKAGLGIGTYNGESITNSGGGATTVNTNCSGNVTAVLSSCFSEDFSSIIDGDNTSTTGSSTDWPGNSNFPTVVNAYEAGGAVKIGKSTASGSITSMALTSVSGDVTVNFDVKGWTTVEGDIIVTLDGTSKTISYTAVMADNFETKSVIFTGVNSGSTLKFATSAKRAFIDNVVLNCASFSPSLSVTPTSLSGFTYALGAGPSAEKTYSLSGTNLTAGPITVTAPTDYEVSLSSGSGFGSSVSVSYTAPTLAATTIYVRLKAGLAAGSYNGQLIQNEGGDASAVTVYCNGNVTGPTLSLSATTISGLSYSYGTGPSTSLPYTLSGSGLTGSGTITVTSPADYEISTDNTNFSAALALPYGSGIVTGQPVSVYVRLKAGLVIGTYNGQTISNAGGGASTVNVTLNGEVYDPSAVPTVLAKGDFAILAVNTTADASGSADEISFVCFKDLNPGTVIYFTDNGYERLYPGLWGNSEGVVSIERINTVLPAGTIITIHTVDGGVDDPTDFTIYTCGGVDNKWEKTVLDSPFDLNKDDQVWFMQGGVWGNLVGIDHDATYTGGNVLYGWTDIDWKTAPGYSSTKGSTIYPGCNCFVTNVNNPVPGASQVKFNDPIAGGDFLSVTNAKLDWIAMINDTANWDYYTSDAAYDAGGFDYLNAATCPTMTIALNVYVDGKWTGLRSIDWFECENWNTFVIPDETTNVIIPSTGVTHEPTIGDPPTFPVVYTGAECNNIDIQTGRTLTMNHANSLLDVYGNWQQNGSVSFTNGIVNILDDNSTMTGFGTKVFYDLNLNKTANSNTLTLGSDISISREFLMQSGHVLTGSNKLELGTGTSSLGTLNYTTGYVVGTMRRWFSGTNSDNATGLFPLGFNDGGYKNRNFFIRFTAAPATPGYLDVYFNPVPMGTAGLPLSVGAVGSCAAFSATQTENEGYWVATPGAGMLGSAAYTLSLTGEGFDGIANLCQLTLLKRVGAGNWTGPGIHLQPTGTVTVPIVSRSGISDFSNFGFGSDNTNPLPVSLLYFNAECDNGKTLLSWATASEVNNDRYIIQRSTNTRDYQTIGTMPGAGNSNAPIHYAFADPEAAFENVYYRLTQVDYDGRSESFGPISSRCSPQNDDDFVLLSLTNSGYAQEISYQISSPDPVQVCVYDATGRRIRCDEHQGESGIRKLQLEIAEGSGLYLISLSNGTKMLSAKIFIP